MNTDGQSRLSFHSRYDLFIFEESTLFDDGIFGLIMRTIFEMGHRPFVIVVADFAQLPPIGRCKLVYRTVHKPSVLKLAMRMHENARTTDEKLLQFLKNVGMPLC